VKANKIHYFSTLFYKQLYMFRTDCLSIIRSLLVCWLSSRQSAYWYDKYRLLWIQY